MNKNIFKALESSTEKFNLNEFLSILTFNADGIIPAIAQQYDSKEVLMMAWMNKQSIINTLETGKVCYWSRSRQKLWFKGEESGNTQQLKSLSVDCDGDSILLEVNQQGVACHTGRKHCFYWHYNPQQKIFEIINE